MMTLAFTREKMPALLPVSMDTSCFATLSEGIPEITLRRGDTVFSGQAAVRFIWLVVKGMVKTYSFHDGKEMLEDYYQQDELVNADALFGKQGDWVAEAISQPTIVKRIPIEDFQKAMSGSASLYGEVLANVNAALSRTKERLHRVTLLGSQQRVVHFLASHVMKSGRKVGYDWVVQPALTHQEMGFIAGTGRQTVTTVLNELRREGIVHFTRNYLIVRDLSALRKKLEMGDSPQNASRTVK